MVLQSNALEEHLLKKLLVEIQCNSLCYYPEPLNGTNALYVLSTLHMGRILPYTPQGVYFTVKSPGAVIPNKVALVLYQNIFLIFTKLDLAALHFIKLFAMQFCTLLKNQAREGQQGKEQKTLVQFCSSLQITATRSSLACRREKTGKQRRTGIHFSLS